MRSPRSVISVLALLLAALGGILLTGCPQGSPGASPLVSTRAYSGHENDQDANNFVRAYPARVGTRLDDCQLCHKVGVTAPKSLYNPCSYCHLIRWPDTQYAPSPADYKATLNTFGRAYLDNGRSIEAFAAIASLDSDGDGATNADEIADNRFPGNASSKPGQAFAPTKIVTLAQVQAMTQHPEFLLMNTTKQQYDDYATYNGPTVKDLLVAAGVDLTGATGVSVFAPDGFKTDFTIQKVNNIGPAYPDTVFYAVPQPFSDPLLNFVNYPATLPLCPSTGVTYKNGDPITGLQLTVAWQRDGSVLSTSYYDPSTGRLEGEGPFRVIPPQSTAGRPDRGSLSSQDPVDTTWNYLSSLDHNAGNSPRGACIIRVNPMPAGLEEYDTSNGWSLMPDKKIVIYGNGVN